MAYSYNSGSALRQGMIFQVNIYVMDIVWMLCDVYEWRSKFNRVIWFCNASLRIFFKCKAP